METLIMQPENNEQTKALTAFAKALKIKFISGENPSPGGDKWFLDPNNIAEVKEGIQDKQFTKIDDPKNIGQISCYSKRQGKKTISFNL